MNEIAKANDASIEEQRLAKIRREIQIGLDQLKRGEGVVYNEHSLTAMFEEIKQEGRKVI